MIKITRNILIHSDHRTIGLVNLLRHILTEILFDKPKGFEYEKHYPKNHNSQV